MSTLTSSRSVRRGWFIAIGIIAAIGVAATVMLHYRPQQLPGPIAQLGETLFGINPHPVKLIRPPVAPLSAVAQIGKQIFFDPSLSASGKQSCASCHSPQSAYAPPNALSVQLGGPNMTFTGFRATPSLAYLYRQAVFSIGPEAEENDAPQSLTQLAASALNAPRQQKAADVKATAPAMVPQGGFFWDGRASTLQDQAIGPLTNPAEMANADNAEVVRKLLKAGYGEALQKIFGPSVTRDQTLFVSQAMFAVGRYQFEDPSFHEFSSKYDYWLEGRARLTSAELHGMQLFNDKDKGNCAACHLSQPTPDGQPPLFTDTQYEALGVPRNRDLPANRTPTFYDMGVCGPFRTDMAAQTQYCGMFLTPTLRNVAKRHVFFHNGVYHDLKQVLDFYNLRTTQPEKIYPRDGNGHIQQYDDLPTPYRANVDVFDAPFDRQAGAKPALSDVEIDDIIAFLKTLDDGLPP
jgi:cytochrome c peroxidase